jgi:hypothetical protein
MKVNRIILNAALLALPECLMRFKGKA